MSADGWSEFKVEPVETEIITQPVTRRVWDFPVRVFHWSLVLAFVGAYITHRAGIEYFKYHVWCGYAVIVLLSFRIIWGLVGTRHARFWNFIRGPVTTGRYTVAVLRGKEKHYAGHNPLGALMVVALLASLSVQALAGLFANDEIFNLGPLYAYVSAQRSLELTSLHRQLFYWILAAVVLHVVAVIAHRIFKKEKLVKAMIVGRKPAEFVKPADEIKSSRIWLAAVIVVVVASTLAWIIKHAPVADTAVF
jgi:cytochrome b